MGNTLNTESAPLTASPPNRAVYSIKPAATQTMVLEVQDHINIFRDTPTPCPICKKVNCGKR